MPLEELLALYGYNSKDKESSSESEEDEEEPRAVEQEQICEPIVEKERSPTPPTLSKLSLLYEPIVEDADDGRADNSVSRMSVDEDEEVEESSNLEDDDYQKGDGGIHVSFNSKFGIDLAQRLKNIMVGSDYQALVPEGLSLYDQANEGEDQLLWYPTESLSNDVEEYLRRAHEMFKPPIPKGNMVRDDEEALYLLQECGYNVDEALRKLEIRGPTARETSNGHDAKWSEEECRNFESGVRSFGKDFLQIQQNKVQSKSVGELVQFYYLWKKTERHDVFANKCRLEKKKYSFHPGFTDFMDRFMEDPDNDNKSSVSSFSGKSSDS